MADLGPDPEPDDLLRAVARAFLGLSTVILLDQTTAAEALQVLDRHFDHLTA